MPILTIDHFSKTYGKNKIKAVDDLSLTIEAGDIYGFIGHNGAGKTTTIKAIAGILDFEEGHILIDGHDIVKASLAAKAVTAYVPDNPDLYEHLNGIGYLNFIADIYGISAADRSKDIGALGEAFGITPSLGDIISSYSHGMKQKLAVIGALLHHPKLMILDEPFVGLDPVAAATLKEYMAETCAAGGAVFFSTHVLDVAQKLCTKIAMIDKGKLVIHGDMNEVLKGGSLEEMFLAAVREEGASYHD